ncbi:hypothetical protein [Mycobacterium simiae]|nr:hypothetical protein [Mycobacterium simiae]
MNRPSTSGDSGLNPERFSNPSLLGGTTAVCVRLNERLFVLTEK